MTNAHIAAPRSLPAKLAGRFRERGFWGGLRYLRWYGQYYGHYLLHDRIAERREGISTSSLVLRDELDIEHSIRAHCVEYLATPRLSSRLALRRVEQPPGELAFVDVGSGLGRVLLQAARLPFAEVVGYELSPRLHRGALANIEAAAAKGLLRSPVTSVHANALEADWPARSCVFFLFNPFDELFTRAFLQRIVERRASGRQDVILFLNLRFPRLPGEFGLTGIGDMPVLEALYWKLLSPYSLTVLRT
jgi:hypothetical protein